MVRVRGKNKLVVLIAVVFALGLNFAWVPWPGSGFLAIAIAIPLFGSHHTLVELVAFYGVIALIGTAMMPSVSVVHKPRRAASFTTTPASSNPKGSRSPQKNLMSPTAETRETSGR